MPRKTIPVEHIKQWTNKILDHPEKEISGMVAGLTPEQAYRQATAAILEAVLHETGNYYGYGYLDVDWTDKEDPIIPDHTRRRYN